MRIYVETLPPLVSLTYRKFEKNIIIKCVPFEKDNEMSFFIAKHCLATQKDVDNGVMDSFIFETLEMNDTIVRDALSYIVEQKTYRPSINTRVLFRAFMTGEQKNVKEIHYNENDKENKKVKPHKVYMKLPVPTSTLQDDKPELRS